MSNNKDLALLSNIQASLGVGKIYKAPEAAAAADGGCGAVGLFYSNYQVSSIKDFAVIIDHFDLYPLITHKWSDYLLFKQVPYSPGIWTGGGYWINRAWRAFDNWRFK